MVKKQVKATSIQVFKIIQDFKKALMDRFHIKYNLILPYTLFHIKIIYNNNIKLNYHI